MTNLSSRITALEGLLSSSPHLGDGSIAVKRRAELLLSVTNDENRRKNLLKTIWHCERGYMQKWLEAEDAARPTPWANMTYDQRAAEKVKRMRADEEGGDGFLYAHPNSPDIPDADLADLALRYPPLHADE